MNGMNPLCVKQNSFGKRRFAGIDMRAYPDIANFLIVDLHFTLFLKIIF
jgi:hypothetical protein